MCDPLTSIPLSSVYPPSPSACPLPFTHSLFARVLKFSLPLLPSGIITPPRRFCRSFLSFVPTVSSPDFLVCANLSFHPRAWPYPANSTPSCSSSQTGCVCTLGLSFPWLLPLLRPLVQPRELEFTRIAIFFLTTVKSLCSFEILT